MLRERISRRQIAKALRLTYDQIEEAIGHGNLVPFGTFGEKGKPAFDRTEIARYRINQLRAAQGLPPMPPPSTPSELAELDQLLLASKDN